MKNWGLDQIGFTVDPTLIFDMTKAKALYVTKSCQITKNFGKTSIGKKADKELFMLENTYRNNILSQISPEGANDKIFSVKNT